MKGLVLCNKGIEEITSLDIKEILKRESKLEEGYVTLTNPPSRQANPYGE